MLSGSQQTAMEEMESGKNIFLTGKAGTGKSFLIREFIKLQKKKNILLCAPTGIAAINIGGSTLHRTFRVPIGPVISSPQTIPELVKKADIIIIDEISMCRADIFTYCAGIIQMANEGYRIPKGKAAIQLIVIGDFCQLPPVFLDKDKVILKDLKEGYAFESSRWKEFHFKYLELKDSMRQEESAFVDNLNKVREGSYAGVTWINEHASKKRQPGIYICSTNKKAAELNEKGLSGLSTKKKTYYAEESGQIAAQDRIAPQVLSLKVGARIMTLVNDPDGEYQNGSLGVVSSLTLESIYIKLDNGKEKEISRKEWEIIRYAVEDGKIVKEIIGRYVQFPLKLSYAITIHKSQGQTYDSANLYPSCFASGQLYVALSRVKSIDTLHLEMGILKKDLIVSESVKEFYLRERNTNKKSSQETELKNWDKLLEEISNW